ncbi:MAG: crotonobetainyl-CoA--carnitine CoA-transferase [Flammeovirgaceae bacterium]|nr:crotonobetainyl-CoA--carnitine CoA-transferase [Flammeovirgaceae bacterium]|tara:strand:- start:117 stop:872 length:756 start_codon:yes stop_codon:yes gene_type:complete
MKKNTDIPCHSGNNEIKTRKELLKLFKESPVTDDQKLENLGLFLNSKNLSRILFMDYLYRKIIDVQGQIFEFGTRWGQNVALFSSLRGIYEPFNRHRKIVAFDTFEGFPCVHENDGNSTLMKVGQLALSPDYEKYLEKIMCNLELDNPLSHIKKFEIYKGDATQTVKEYLEKNQHTIISLVYFDFDLYKPTKECLKLIVPRLTKGSIVGFDELNDPDSPGETLALMEIIGLQNVRLKRYPHASRVSYYEVE